MKFCLIGNNLTNFLLAGILAKKKIYVDIIQTNKNPKISNFRTIAISNKNLSFIENNFQNLKIYSWPSKKIKIFIQNKKEELFEFGSPKKDVFNLFRYKDLNDQFLKKLKKKRYVKFLKFPKDEIKFFKEKKYDLIINSFYYSQITKKYFFKKIKKDYNSFAYSFEIKHEKIKNDTAYQYFTQNGPIAFLPISNSSTSIVFSYNGKKKLNDKNLVYEIYKLNTNYKIKKFEKFEKYNLQFLTLRKYFYNNILAFGDLIHKVHPLAGQGFNMTIRDIVILSKIIEDKLSLGLEVDSSVAQEFENKTQHLNYLYSSLIDFIYEFFKFDSKNKNIFSKNFLKIFKNNKLLNRLAVKISNEGFYF